MKEMNFTTAAIAGKYKLKMLVICYAVTVLIAVALKQVVIHCGRVCYFGGSAWL
jgi:hypothetical protein